jgi:hypothetical protein
MHVSSAVLNKKGFLPVVVGACLLAASAAQATVKPPVFDAPGIPAAGFPDFMGSISATAVWGDSGVTLNVTGTNAAVPTFSLDGTHQYAVQNEKYNLYLNYGFDGSVSGKVSITGAISGLHVAQQNLYTANIIGAAFGDNFSLGLKTTNVGESGWASKYQNGPESVYLYNLKNFRWSESDFGNLNRLNHDDNPSLRFTGLQFTTVPLPAAAWLLVSGIAGLSSFVRRRIAGA